MSPDVFALWKKKKPKYLPESDLTSMSSRPTYHTSSDRTSTSSDPSGIVDGFGRLSLSSPDGRRHDVRQQFIGGFTPHSTVHGHPGAPQANGPFFAGVVPPPPILHYHGGAHSTPSLSTSFPEPNQYPAPGPLPPPPQVSMPAPQTSRTMRYAIGNNSNQSPSPKDNLRPPILTRPHSDSNGFPSSSNLQPPATPQRPHLQQAPNSAPAKPASSAPNSRPSLALTPTKRPRAASSPPSPTVSTSSNSKGELKVQCSGTTKLDKRCTRMVAVTAPLSRLNGEDLPHYCHQHINTAFDDVKFPSHKDSGVWVEFGDWIPEYLQKETQEQLRKEMRTKRSAADVPGYIYAFEIDDTTHSDVVHIKVGRAVKLTKRLAEWDKQCQSKQTHLRGFWPSTKDADDGNLGRGRVQVGDPAPWCHKLERLIHLELADLVVNAPYLEPGYPNVQGGTGSANDSRTVSRTACPDCAKVHQEIFSFRVAKGRYRGKEWEELVKPVIEKWGGFVDAYV